MSKPFNIHDWQSKQKRLAEIDLDKAFFKGMGPGGEPIPDEVDSQGRNTWGDKVGYAEDQIEDEITKYIDHTFASWMSPDHPPFHQDYAKPPYIDKLVKGIMGILPARMSKSEHNEASMTGTGASITTGDSMAYATPNAFKKKRKED